MYVSREYQEKVAPVWHEVPEDHGVYSYDAGCVNASLWFSGSWNIEGQMGALKTRCGFGEEINEGINWAYASSDTDAETVLLVGSILFVIMLSGYLIVYNIFYISVTNDIKFYGLLKTIGMTNRQLRRIVRKQALMLCLAGVPAGLLFGYIASYGIMPVIMKNFFFAADNYVISVNPLIFAGGALFTVLTVLVSCIKPCIFVSKISPVEAVRYTENTSGRKKSKKTKNTSAYQMARSNIKRTPKKTAAVVLSLSLSMVILNASVTIVGGFDMDKYVEDRIISDFYVTDATVTNRSLETVTNGVGPEDMQALFSLAGVTETGRIYMREAQHFLSGSGVENANRIYEEYYDMFSSKLAFDEMGRMMREENIVASHFYGVDGLAMSKLKINDGVFDEEKFKSGDYIIVSPFFDNNDARFYDIGDKVTLDFGGGITKEYEVMAIGDIPYATGPQHSHLFDVYFTMYSDEFTAKTGETGALDIIFNAKGESVPAIAEAIENYCKNSNPNLGFKSRSMYVAEFNDMHNMYLLVGSILSLVLALIGILNFINSSVTSVQARARELAVLQAVGMTGRQLKRMLITEGTLYSAAALIFTLTAGNVLSYAFVQAVAGQMWFFTYRFRYSLSSAACRLLPYFQC